MDVITELFGGNYAGDIFQGQDFVKAAWGIPLPGVLMPYNASAPLVSLPPLPPTPTGTASTSFLGQYGWWLAAGVAVLAGGFFLLRRKK